MCNRLILSSASPWTHCTLHWVKHFFNHSLVIAHLPGCGYTDSFCRRSKVKPLKIPVKNVKTQQMFYDIGVNSTITAPMIVLFSEWTCLVYGTKKCINTDDARLEIFLRKYKTDTTTSCSRVPLQKIRRTELITRRWLTTTEQTPPPENNDWKPNDSGCKILRFESTATLKIVLGMDLAEDSFLKIPLNCL